MPSGLVISLLIHAGAFFLAGLLIVFTVKVKADSKFVAPVPQERPVMKLKIPKVRIQKNSQPKPSSRIVANVQNRAMPEIMLPDLNGTGEGLLDGVSVGAGEVIDLPDFIPTIFGGGGSSGNDLKVSYYNLNLKRDGSPATMDPDAYKIEIMDFLKSGWNKSILDKFY
ncbi:MAG: hypothetical protein JXR25_13455, partial [Pontiellaceae bacterium]|nr:hypothetical protein [Pontiellaceae bacterium]